MKKVTGDLIELAKQGKFDVILHGCNCFNVMGAGIAKQIKQAFPLAFEADKNFMSPAGSPHRLGRFSYSYSFLGGAKTGALTVINLYTQFGYRTSQVQNMNFSLTALQNALVGLVSSGLIAKDMTRIGYPKIGAGLGGGKWEDIEETFDFFLNDFDHTLVELPCS